MCGCVCVLVCVQDMVGSVVNYRYIGVVECMCVVLSKFLITLQEKRYSDNCLTMWKKKLPHNIIKIIEDQYVW